MVRAIDEVREMINRQIQDIKNDRVKEILHALNDYVESDKLLEFLLDVCTFNFNSRGIFPPEPYNPNHIKTSKTSRENGSIKCLEIEYYDGAVKISTFAPDEKGMLPNSDRTVLLVKENGDAVFGNIEKDPVLLRFKIKDGAIFQEKDKPQMEEIKNLNYFINKFQIDEVGKYKLKVLLSNPYTSEIIENLQAYSDKELQRDQDYGKLLFMRDCGMQKESIEFFRIEHKDGNLFMEISENGEEYKTQLSITSDGDGEIYYIEDGDVVRQTSFNLQGDQLTNFVTKDFEQTKN